MWLLLASLAHAHDADFGVTQLSVAPSNPAVLWGVSRGWGIVHSTDGGVTWQWFCEEGLGVSTLYDVDAMDDGRALLAGVSGLVLLDPDCGQSVVPGLPEGAFADDIRRYDGGWLVAVYGDKESGAFACTTEGCAPTELVGPDLYLKSFGVDAASTAGGAAGTVWATTVTAGTLVSDLWRSNDGQSWSHVYSWPDGTVDPRVLDVRGDRLLVWAQSRDEDHTPALLRSEDAGLTWTSVLAFGAYTDDVPSMVQVGGGFWYLGNKSLHVYQSIDDGESWVDVNSYHPEIPSVRCVSDDGRYVCGDHFADGYDIARVVGFGFDAVACLDDATPASCLSGACDTYYEDFLARGEYGGGYCTADLSPAPATGGCGGQGVAAGAFVAGYAAHQLRRRSLRR